MIGWAIALTVWAVGCICVWRCDPDTDATPRERGLIALTWFFWAIVLVVIAAVALAGAIVQRLRRNPMTRYHKG